MLAGIIHRPSKLGARMPRPPRLHVPGAFYHVILRGNHREALFASAADRIVLNEIVADSSVQVNARIHAFCWMTNHLHALVQIGDTPMGKLMQRIAVRYSRYRHRQLRTTGHLFERRYKALIVDVDAYFVTLLRYIHLNPVKAAMVSDPADYPWSSHRAYLGIDTLDWLMIDVGLGLFSGEIQAARVAYRVFMAQSPVASEDSLLDETHPEDRRILGSDRFVATLQRPAFTPRKSITLEQLATQICRDNHSCLATVRSASRQRSLTATRVQIVTQALDGRIANLREVAAYLGREPHSLSELITRHRR